MRKEHVKKKDFDTVTNMCYTDKRAFFPETTTLSVEITIIFGASTIFLLPLQFLVTVTKSK